MIVTWKSPYRSEKVWTFLAIMEIFQNDCEKILDDRESNEKVKKLNWPNEPCELTWLFRRLVLQASRKLSQHVILVGLHQLWRDHGDSGCERLQEKLLSFSCSRSVWECCQVQQGARSLVTKSIWIACLTSVMQPSTGFSIGE
jgi:hypothetical protein